ncbi:M23 family metallopeptidase [Curvivirga aplysinae]|uniref:M23 family metallopeptidase n=1 Tax=Curvivirga aplysinae TaxID=2529852 RepID=UPI0012BB6EB2|nr:M23 family metallopeptidase [Curvivirga aplysinae]MTI08645.1 M23 family metallopeptidase [Curvivirga aplysinae]
MKSKIVNFWKKRLGQGGRSIQLNDPFQDLDEEMQESFPELGETTHGQEKQKGVKGIKRFKPFAGKSHKNPLATANVDKARLIGAAAFGSAIGMFILAGLGVWTDIWEGKVEEVAIPEVEIVQPAPVVEVIEEGPLEAVDTVILGEIKSGDTLANIMVAAGASQRDTHLATRSFNKVFSVRKLRPGQKTSIRLIEGDEGPILEEFTLEPDQKRKVISTRQTDGSFETVVEEVPLSMTLKVSNGVIDSSLYVAATTAGIPSRVLADLINIFSFDVDFQREIQKGDSFALMYESLQDEAGREIETGKILVAEMTLSGDHHKYYRFKPKNEFADYYTSKGQSVRKALLRTPIDGARISSGFGNRKHPVLGYTKLHKGTDFAAPRGTPIYAAGDGVIEIAGWNGSFGKYVRIRHNGTYKTAYAHMHNIAKGISNGKRVRQRQVIGYVGTTGRSTGNHLHFEVHKNGRAVNPLSVKLPTGKKLNKQQLKSFNIAKAELDKMYDAEKAAQIEPFQSSETVQEASVVQ